MFRRFYTPEERRYVAARTRQIGDEQARSSGGQRNLDKARQQAHDEWRRYTRPVRSR